MCGIETYLLIHIIMEKKIQAKIKAKKLLSEEEQFMIFDFEDPVLWLKLYVKHYKLASSELECKMISLRNIALLNFYWKRYIAYSHTVDMHFETGDVELLKLFVKNNVISTKLQLKLIEMNNAELLKEYMQGGYFSNGAEEKFLELWNEELLRFYIRRYYFSPAVELAFVEKNDTALLSYYVKKHKLTQPAKERIYQIADKEVLRVYTNTWVYPKAWNK